ncbi:MAG: LytTR family DNA-binding domain-containing protein [Bacteroidia bacterium]|nr:LytTR family DNA-binding domain-containing protein [Bacteroidia bacterium]
MKVVIVDDERLSREELKKLLKKNHPEVEVIAECVNAEEGKQKIEELKPDLVFLDIEMPDKTGFEMLNEINAIPDVVFISAYDEYAIKAFEFQALDYILKPIDAQRLADCIRKYQVKEEKENQVVTKTDKLNKDARVFMKDGDRCWFVALKDIILFESLGNYVKVHLSDSHPVIFNSLNALEERLPSDMFFRANRKFIINLFHVTSISTWVNNGYIVKLSNGAEIDLSRRQSVRFKELFIL